jgi:hypothetical protein
LELQRAIALYWPIELLDRRKPREF